MKFVMEGIESERQVTQIFISDSFMHSNDFNRYANRLKSSQADVYVLPDNLFREVSDTENPQGILAVAKMPDYSLYETVQGESLVVILEEVQDPGNMGTILRTAHAAGFNAVIVLKGSVDVYNPKTIRSSAGSIFHIPVILCENVEECMRYLKGMDIKIFGAHLDAKKSHYQVKLDKNAAILIGNEARGLSDGIIKYVDEKIKIPIPGGAESLNASVAAGIIIYEAVRQRYYF